MSHVTSVRCPRLLNLNTADETECGDEIEIEWDQIESTPKKTGRKVCRICGTSRERFILHSLPLCEDFEGMIANHEWVDEWGEGDVETEIISFKSYCFHPLTRTQATELLDDLAVRRAEQRAEGE